jgi:RNA polymerase sigma factor (sigma-70 family)
MKPGALVIVIDDDPSVRKSLKRLLGSRGYAVKLFGSAKEYLDKNEIIHSKPCCLILDVRMPGLDGMDLHQELKKRNISTPIVFISGHGNIPLSVKAMKRGAVDFLPKPFDSQNLLEAIEIAIDKDLKAKKEQKDVNEIRNLLKKLTPREYETFRWLITGMLNKQIASEMGVTEKTIKVHRGRVMKKLQADSVASLVRLAQKAGVDPAK